MKRISAGSEPEAVRPDAGDYFIVSGDAGVWLVSTEMARFIEAELDAKPMACWIKFVDLAGSRIRLRTREITTICQCTAEQRAFEREFRRALSREPGADRSWGEDG